MRKSNLLLAGGALALMAATPAMAMDWSDPYVQFGGGFSGFSPSLTDLDTDNGGYTPSSTAEPGRSMNFNAVLGGTLMSGLRGEVGVTVMNGSGSLNVQGEGSGVIGVNATTFAMMGNIWKDFELTDNITMHIGGGLGAGYVRASIDSNSGPDSTSGIGLAYMAGIGGAYALSNGGAITLDFRLNGITGNLGSVEAQTSWETIGGTLSTGPSAGINVGIRIPTGG
jgi:opacity protein-like surface antigen